MTIQYKTLLKIEKDILEGNLVGIEVLLNSIPKEFLINYLKEITNN